MSEEAKLKQLKTIQTLGIVALIAAPVSLLIGGLLLSSAALVCSIIAFVKIRHLRATCDSLPGVSQSLYRQTVIALVVSITASVFNLVWFIFALTTLMQIIQSGDYEKMINTLASGDFSVLYSTDNASGASVWD